MTAKSNLRPVVVIDVNGKITTVHKKNPSASTGFVKPLVPPVAASTDSKERRRLARESLRILDEDGRVADKDGWEKSYKTIKSNIESYPRETLEELHELCSMMSQNTHSPDMWKLVRELEKNDFGIVRFLCSHREWIASKPAQTGTAITLFESLRRLGIQQDDDGRMPTVELHVQAKRHYDTHRNARIAYALVTNYEYNSEYMTMVEKHADHIDDLLAYRAARGLEDDEDGPAPLDEQEFEEYLKYGSVKDGWL